MIVYILLVVFSVWNIIQHLSIGSQQKQIDSLKSIVLDTYKSHHGHILMANRGGCESIKAALIRDNKCSTELASANGKEKTRGCCE